MIIGISGKANSGKDTVAKILQYFTLPESERTLSIDDWIYKTNDALLNSENKRCELEIRKFATKSNECISILTGIPTERLSLRDVKNSVLPKQWNRWVLEVATPTIGETDIIVCASREEAITLINYFGVKPSEYELTYRPITVRQFMQWYATDVMRTEHPNIWVNALFSDYKQNRTKSKTHEFKFPNWVITDVRFPNELMMIQNNLGQSKIDEDDFRFTIRINRNIDAPVSETSLHESEIALDEVENWDYVIENDCALPELAFEIHTMLKSRPEFKKYFHI